ncbi:hypothetical protein BJY00DRAFT_324204 [Aspergillus carlsbadensis]|nr:hypothetical protein BJY00DRAFT_324204 [Aspergillus carlsbadensis]
MVGIQPVEPANIPVIDFKALSAGAPQERKDALDQLDQAFQTYGFIYLSNHGIGQEMVDEAMSWIKRFFSLPKEVKETIAHPQNASDHRGWAAVGAGIVSQGIWDPSEIEHMRETEPPEQKEILEMGNPHSSDDPHANPFPNRLLSEEVFPGFRAFLEKWWDACVEQELAVLRCLCEILRIPDRDILGKQQSPRRNRSHMSWLHYLSMPVSPLKKGIANRLNTHTDFGQLTLLFQDMVGGLEIHDDELGIYRPVLPKAGTMIIHIGDILERQSNGRWKSALHRVTAPTALKYGDEGVAGEDTVVDRYTLAFYAHPDYEMVVEPLPGCEKKGKWSSLEWGESMTAGDWMDKRVALEYEHHNPAKATA